MKGTHLRFNVTVQRPLNIEACVETRHTEQENVVRVVLMGVYLGTVESRGNSFIVTDWQGKIFTTADEEWAFKNLINLAFTAGKLAIRISSVETIFLGDDNLNEQP